MGGEGADAQAAHDAAVHNNYYYFDNWGFILL